MIQYDDGFYRIYLCLTIGSAEVIQVELGRCRSLLYSGRSRFVARQMSVLFFANRNITREGWRPLIASRGHPRFFFAHDFCLGGEIVGWWDVTCFAS